MKKIRQFKKGAASFYIVAISTLILVIIAASFAAVIISEVTRTSNDDLAQSAYDSALAGVEDAKLAYYNYQSCLESGGEGCDNIEKLIKISNCLGGAEGECTSEVMSWIETNGEEKACDMVADILQRVPTENGVLVQESDTGNNDMQQYYTCARIKTILSDYRTTLNGNNPAKVVKAKFSEVSAGEIQSIRVSWHADSDDTVRNYSNFSNDGIFGDTTPVPAVLSVGLVQTAGTFKLDQFDMTQGETTNRGTLYLVPTDDPNLRSVDRKYNVAQDGRISKDGFLKSNDKTTTNLPYAVYCGGENDGFACSTVIELPDPVEGNRNDETFMIVLSIPYTESSTDVRLEFCSTDSCFVENAEAVNEAEKEPTVVYLKGMQVSIDSTGRANDLYRRVETRLEPADAAAPYPLYAIQVLGDNGNNSLIDKNLSPTCENNFIDSPNCE